MSKILWLDTETTGTEPTIHSIIQISGIIDIDGQAKEEFKLNVRPHPDFEINDQSIDIHGISIEQMNSFPEIKQVHQKLLDIWEQYISKFDRNDKFTIAGQKIFFDLDFLSHFFMRLKDNYLGSYINFKSRIDLLDITRGLQALGIIKSENVKLEVLCKEFGIPIQAHDSLSDIRATRKLYYLFKSNLVWKDNINTNILN